VNKFFIVSALTLSLVACGSHQAPAYEKEKRPEDRGQYSGIEGVIQKQKDQAYMANQANKLRCQDSRLDLVDAEAEGDINMIRQVKSRVQKDCVVEKR
jgi:predicted metal-dependent phosphoesterase TrpH